MVSVDWTERNRQGAPAGPLLERIRLVQAKSNLKK